MLIELAILPQMVQQQILEGERIEFTYQGQIVADLTPKSKPIINDKYGVFGILKGVDGVEFQNVLREE